MTAPISDMVFSCQREGLDPLLMVESGDVTRILRRLTGGESQAFEELLPLVYEELRTIAQGYMRRAGPGHTLQPTALVN